MKAKRILHILCVALCFLAISACKGDNKGRSFDGPDPNPGPKPNPIPGPEEPIDPGGICDPGQVNIIGDLTSEGDLIELHFCDDGQLRVSLPTSSFPTTPPEEYVIAFANSTDIAQSYMITSVDDSDAPNLNNSTAVKGQKSDMNNAFSDQDIPVMKKANRMIKRGYHRKPIKVTSPATNVGEKTIFRVRDNIGDPDSVASVIATLMRNSGRIKIFVDDDVFSADSGSPAFGTMLDDLVAAFNAHVYPTVQGLYSNIPDINQDGTVTLLFTPRMNYIFKTDSCPKNDSMLFKFEWADPRDLMAFNRDENPVSNEQEIIYLPAPDSVQPNVPPFNIDRSVPLLAYVNPVLLGGITYRLAILANYHNRVNLNTYQAEDPIINSGLAMVAADLGGFSSAVHGRYFQYAMYYLDHPECYSLLGEGSDCSADDTIETQARYYYYYLFMRYITEQASATASFSDFIDPQNGMTLIANILSLTSMTIFRNFALATFVSQNPSVDTSGLSSTYKFAANGTAGITIGTAPPVAYTELVGPVLNGNTPKGEAGSYYNNTQKTKLDGPDPQYYLGHRIFGKIAPHGIAFAKLANLVENTTGDLMASITDTGVTMYILRKEDVPATTTYIIENDFGSLNPNPTNTSPGAPFSFTDGDLQEIVISGHIDPENELPVFASTAVFEDGAYKLSFCSDCPESTPTSTGDVDIYKFTIASQKLLKIELQKKADSAAGTSAFQPYLALLRPGAFNPGNGDFLGNDTGVTNNFNLDFSLPISSAHAVPRVYLIPASGTASGCSASELKPAAITSGSFDDENLVTVQLDDYDPHLETFLRIYQKEGISQVLGVNCFDYIAIYNLQIIEVGLGTDAAEAGNSTAADVVTAINTTPCSNTIVTASGDGIGIATSLNVSRIGIPVPANAREQLGQIFNTYGALNGDIVPPYYAVIGWESEDADSDDSVPQPVHYFNYSNVYYKAWGRATFDDSENNGMFLTIANDGNPLYLMVGGMGGTTGAYDIIIKEIED